MRKYKYHILVLLLIAFVFAWVEYNSPKPKDKRYTYSTGDKIMYGASALYDVLRKSNPDVRFRTVNRTAYLELRSREMLTNSCYVFLNSQVDLSETDQHQLLDYISRGNTVLFIANYFSGNFFDSLGIRSEYEYQMNFNTADSSKHYVEITLRDSAGISNHPFKFETNSWMYFSKYDSVNGSVLAQINRKFPVLIEKNLGRGKIYFCAVPELFLNRNIVSDPNRYFAYSVFSKIDAREIWWDEYYKNYNRHHESPFEVLFNDRALYAAYLLTLISVLVFMIFEVKRRQRPIPVIEPPANSTLAFIDVITNVYFHSGSHKPVLIEMINGFRMFLKNKFGFIPKPEDKALIERMAMMSTVPEEEINSLLVFLYQQESKSHVQEADIKSTYNRIEQFKRKNQR